MKNNYIACMKIFELNLLLYKVQQKKKTTNFLCNYAITKMISGYYFTMIKNLLIIQRYLNIFKDKEKVLDKINMYYINKTSEINDDNYNENNPLSPSYKNTLDNN